MTIRMMPLWCQPTKKANEISFSENGNRKALFQRIPAFKFIFKITASGIHPMLIKYLLLLKAIML